MATRIKIAVIGILAAAAPPLILAAVLGVVEAQAAPPPPPCRWSWRRLSCPASCAHQPRWRQLWRCAPAPPPVPPDDDDDWEYHQRSAASLALVAIGVAILLVDVAGTPAEPTLARTIYRLLFQRGWRKPGELTGLRFPVNVASLVGPNGAAELTALLKHDGHLPAGVTVSRSTDTGALIRDGVKGEKAILDVEYSGPCDLPSQLFVKCNLPSLSPMRLLCELSEVAKCEACFYRHLAATASGALPSPLCFFADFSEASGEFLLVSEVVRFGRGNLLPLKHRIRDAATLEEVRAFCAAGGALNAALWGPVACGPEVPRFEATHRRFWQLAQVIGRLGLGRTARRTVGGVGGVNDVFMTWRPPPSLLGLEGELISDMPHILRSLCADASLVAYGHNDLTLDNAYWWRAESSIAASWSGEAGALRFGVFDWQQACVNNVGQEWAWNLHFLEPDFLTEHEPELIGLLLETWAAAGHVVDLDAFLRAYVLGCAQMYVFSGGGLQALMSGLHRRGVFASMVPDDDRCRDGSLQGEPELLEKVTGLEMSRRAFTNVCNIMTRHGFVAAWARWRQETGRPPLEPVSS